MRISRKVGKFGPFLSHLKDVVDHFVLHTPGERVPIDLNSEACGHSTLWYSTSLSVKSREKRVCVHFKGSGQLRNIF